jgi:outer membrane protein assembly factor BamB
VQTLLRTVSARTASARRASAACCAAAVVLLGLSGDRWETAQLARAENWPQWRGPRGDGTSQETGLPVQWSKTQNIAWRLPLPGPAGATPVVWGDRIFASTAAGPDLMLLCISTDGKLLWQKHIDEGDQNVRGDEGNYASPSPCTDGEHVWCYMGTGELVCFDFAGNEVWRTNLQQRYGTFEIMFGMTSTPLLDGDRLYLQCLHSAAALVIALDKRTGQEVWRHERQSDAVEECEHSYASPALYRDGGLELLLSHGGDYTTAHRLTDGGEVWRCGGLNPKGNYNPTLRFVASPLATRGLVVVPSAKNGPVVGVDPAAQGDVSESETQRRWFREHDTPDVSSPLVYEGLVYLCREDGRLLCLDAQSGEEQYYQRTHNDRHRASPVAADGHVYLTARDGTVTVVRAGRTFKVEATNQLDEPITASPVISGGRIYLRSFDSLTAIEAPTTAGGK